MKKMGSWMLGLSGFNLKERYVLKEFLGFVCFDFVVDWDL
jgi:hypothetical protein